METKLGLLNLSHPGANRCVRFLEKVPKNFLESSDPGGRKYFHFLFLLCLMFPVQKFLLLIVSLNATGFEVKLIHTPVFKILEKIVGCFALKNFFTLRMG
jgi:hypothetical protein